MLTFSPNVSYPPLRFFYETQFAPWFLWFDVNQAAADLPATVSSWYRTVAHNREVDGAASSQHLIGTAMDVVLPRDSYALLRSRLRWAQFTLDEGDHLHVQLYRATPELLAAVARLAA